MYILTNQNKCNVTNYVDDGISKIVYTNNYLTLEDIGETIGFYTSDDDTLLFVLNKSDYDINIKEDTERNLVIIFAPHKSIDDIKAEKIDELSQKCTSIIYHGIDVDISDGTTEHFTLDEQDQLNLSGLGLELAAGAEFVAWHEDDKSKPCRFYTADDASKIIQSLTIWKSYHITYFRDLRIYVNKALKTKEEVESVEYGMELSDEWKSTVLKYYENILANA